MTGSRPGYVTNTAEKNTETTVKNIRVMNRATSGVRIINIKPGDRVSDIAKLERDENSPDEDTSSEENMALEENSVEEE